MYYIDMNHWNTSSMLFIVILDYSYNFCKIPFCLHVKKMCIAILIHFSFLSVFHFQRKINFLHIILQFSYRKLAEKKHQKNWSVSKKIYVYFEWHVQSLLVKNHILTCLYVQKKPTKNVEKQYFLMFFLVNFKILLKERFFHINVNIVFNFFHVDITFCRILK